MKTHIPVTILTGFLGSGKTTLLNRVLSSPGGNIAVIINEFGEIGLDSGLLKKAQKNFVKMDNGCLCCVLSEELVRTIGRLAKRNDYQAVVLETTGIADPLPIMWPFLRQEFKDKFRFGGIVTVVDVAHFFHMITHQEARVQIERADFLYLAKTDLCGGEETQPVLQELNSLNPQARLIYPHEPLALDIIFAKEVGSGSKNPTGWHGHSKGYESISVPLQGKKMSLNDMEDFFSSLPKEVLRAKAIFASEDGRTLVIHAVCGRVDFYEVSTAHVHAAVFIGRGLDRETLLRDFQSIHKG